MIKSFEDMGAKAKADGKIAETAVVSSNNSVTEQASQIQNLILQGYDAIVVLAGSDTALNGAIKDACNAGITVLQVAKMRGARCIVADIDADRLARAEAFGADAVIHSGRQSVPEAVAGELGGLGPSVVIDGAGVPALLEEACRVAAPAGRIGLLGFSPAPCNVSQHEIVRKELTLAGSRLNRGFIQNISCMIFDIGIPF